MKQQIFRLILAGLFLISKPSINAQDFSVKNKMIIYSECRDLLNEYQQLVNKLAESGRAEFGKSVGTGEQLTELFINRKVLIYNDLDPQHQLSEYYELETYISNMVLWYPDGMEIFLDLTNAKTSDIRRHDEGLYSTDIMVDKKIQGNYLNKTVNANMEELIFRIAFAEQNNNFIGFKIVGVRNSKSAGFIEDNKALYKLKSIELSANEKEKVLSDIKQVLNDYQRSLIMLGDPNETDEDKGFYRMSFLNLFPDSAVKIYNDIEEKPEKTIISVEEYVNNYRDDYPEGIKNLSVNIDSAEFGDIIPMEDGRFCSYIYADKFFSGRYKGKDIFRLSASLVFKIVFEKKNNIFTGFRIENIDRSGLAFFQGAGQAEEQAIPSVRIQPVSRKGFHLSPYLSAGYSSILCKNISSLELETNEHEWQIDPSLGFSGGICVDYFLGDHIGISLGAGYGYFSTTYALHGDFMRNELSHDFNEEPFHKIIRADYDSVLSLSYAQFPVQVIWLSNQPQKTGLYCKAGILASVFIGGKYDFKGFSKYMGWYPENPPEADTLDFPDFGYGFYEKTDQTGDLDMQGFFLSGMVSAGITIPLAYFTTIQIGPVIHVSFMDISKKTDYFDVFGIKYEHKPVSLNYLGLEISIRFL